MDYSAQPKCMPAMPPPPYQSNSGPNSEILYPQQIAFVGQTPHYDIPPPPIPVYTQTTTVIRPIGTFLGHHPQAVQCPLCNQQIITMVHHEPSGATWLIAFLIFIFGGVFGCCLIPFCVSSCQDAVHTCPACMRHIGRRSVF